ncbi:MAG: LysR substrate-binding domain-containing protein [Alphaproteobacteria bacterium]
MTHRTLPPLHAVRAFEAAARHLSMTRAAAELHVTPGAVSRQIRDLELRLGADLFVRGNSGLVLTDPGAVLFRAAKEALDTLALGLTRAQNAPGRQALKLGAYAVFAGRWLIPRLRHFYARNPDIEIEIVTIADPLELPPHRCDAVVTVHDGRPMPGFDVVPLVPIEAVPVCAPRLIGPRPIGPRPTAPERFDLRRHRLLHIRLRPDDWRRWLPLAGIEGVDPDGGLYFESMALAMDAAAEGLGVALAIRALAEADLAQGRLAVPIPVGRRSSRVFALLHETARAREPAVAALRAWLETEAASDRRGV